MNKHWIIWECRATSTLCFDEYMTELITHGWEPVEYEGTSVTAIAKPYYTTKGWREHEDTVYKELRSIIGEPFDSVCDKGYCNYELQDQTLRGLFELFE